MAVCNQSHEIAIRVLQHQCARRQTHNVRVRDRQPVDVELTAHALGDDGGVRHQVEDLRVVDLRAADAGIGNGGDLRRQAADLRPVDARVVDVCGGDLRHCNSRQIHVQLIRGDLSCHQPADIRTHSLDGLGVHRPRCQRLRRDGFRRDIPSRDRVLRQPLAVHAAGDDLLPADAALGDLVAVHAGRHGLHLAQRDAAVSAQDAVPCVFSHPLHTGYADGGGEYGHAVVDVYRLQARISGVFIGALQCLKVHFQRDGGQIDAVLVVFRLRRGGQGGKRLRLSRELRFAVSLARLCHADVVFDLPRAGHGVIMQARRIHEGSGQPVPVLILSHRADARGDAPGV